MAYFPIPIDPTTFGSQPSLGVPNTSMVQGPVLFGGNLYIVLSPNTFTSAPIDVWKSTDGGSTWAALDHANAPSAGIFESCFDGLHTLSVVYETQVSPPAGPWPMNISQFSLLTETWGAASADSPTNVGGPVAILARSDGSLVVFYNPTLAPGTAKYNVLVYTGAWGIPIDFDANAFLVMTNPQGPLNLFCCVDSSDRCHVFFMEQDNPSGTPIDHLFYQLLSSSNTLGTFFEFAGVGTVIVDVPTSFGIPCVVGSDVVFPLFTINGSVDNLSIYVGSPLSGPSFTLFSNVDSAYPGIDSSLAFWNPPAANVIGGAVQIAYVANTADLSFQAGIVRLVQTLDFTTWIFSGATAFDIQTDPSPTGFNAAGQLILGLIPTDKGIASVALDATRANFLRYFFQPSGSPLSIADTPPSGQVGGAYSASFPASGGTPPYSYSKSAGTLPPGLTLDPATGVLSGTPTTVGTFCFTITVTDALSATASVSACITIYASVVITFYGWKLYPESPCGPLAQIAPAPPVLPLLVPQPAPVQIPAPPAAARAPRWKNLCWALRNGAVDASQFAPGVLNALQKRCSELGYAGACLPPPDVQAWLTQNRIAGTLPPITVTQADIDALPPAPPLEGVPCPTSWKLGGLVDDSTPAAVPGPPSITRAV